MTVTISNWSFWCEKLEGREVEGDKNRIGRKRGGCLKRRRVGFPLKGLHLCTRLIFLSFIFSGFSTFHTTLVSVKKKLQILFKNATFLDKSFDCFPKNQKPIGSVTEHELHEWMWCVYSGELKTRRQSTEKIINDEVCWAETLFSVS